MENCVLTMIDPKYSIKYNCYNLQTKSSYQCLNIVFQMTNYLMRIMCGLSTSHPVIQTVWGVLYRNICHQPT